MSDKLLDYEVLSIMGTGSFGTCFKVRSRVTQKIFVWKAIDYADMPDEKRAHLVREINVLKQLAHPNIVRYFNHIAQKDTSTLYIIMECCEGGDLARLIARCSRERCHFEEEFIWRCLFQLCKAIQGCHSFKDSLTILHRDIKPANVFLDADGNVKLGDFGLARVLRGDEDGFAETQVGTPYYMSPEVIKGTKYNRKSDIWSLGCLVYELCALRPPFEGKHMEMLSRNIVDGRFSRIPSIYSGDLQKIIGFLLSVDHGFRPTVETILHHPTVVLHMAGTQIKYPVLVPDAIDSDTSICFTPKPDMSSTKLDDSFATDTTSDLRRQLFHSTGKTCRVSTQSEPDRCLAVQKSTINDDQQLLKKAASDSLLGVKRDDPNEITQEIFNEALRQRLAAIREREGYLKRQEDDIRQREQALKQREKLLRKQPKPSRLSKPHQQQQSQLPKRPISYDASYVSIEPNETFLQKPTIAKFNPNVVRRPKAFQNQRKVNFKSSPRKIFNPIETDENLLPPPRPIVCNKLSYSQKDLADAVSRSLLPSSIKTNNNNQIQKPLQLPPQQLPPQQQYPDNQPQPPQYPHNVPINESEREKPPTKSIFSRFNINFKTTKKNSKPRPLPALPTIVDIPVVDENQPIHSMENRHQIPFCQVDPTTLPGKWTLETKRTAFEMLAVMNANNNNNNNQIRTHINSNNKNNPDQTIIDEVHASHGGVFRHDRKRQSMMLLRPNEVIL